jgi:hypothetical protein
MPSCTSIGNERRDQWAIFRYLPDIETGWQDVENNTGYQMVA